MKLKTIGLFLFFGLVTFSIFSSSYKKEMAKVNAEPIKVAEAPVDYDAKYKDLNPWSAGELKKEYDSNSIAADRKFKGRVVKVEGKITMIGTDVLGDGYVVLSDTNITGIRFSIKRHNTVGMNKIAEFRVGQRVQMIGTVQGEALGSVLIDAF